MFLDSLMGFFSTDVAMDLGTANTLVWVKGRGIVLNEPSVVAVEKSTNRVLAVGSEAKLMLGRTPDEINAVRPLKDGVIADFQVTEHLLREFVQRVQKHKFLVRPRIIICVPSGITEVEKRAVIDSAVRAGCREVLLVPEPIAAAIGVDLPVDTPTGNMVVDIGGGTTEIAVIALNGIVTKTSIRTGATSCAASRARCASPVSRSARPCKSRWARSSTRCASRSSARRRSWPPTSSTAAST